ncbi:MAG: sodium:alanine symporter family protein, partial [Clostridia bacterium]|nr:sodium:alanine symporter family protein [Clostridia bacterium]
MNRKRFFSIALILVLACLLGCACAEEAAAPSFVDKVSEINGAVNSFAWGPIMLALLVGSGVYLSIRTGFIQVGKFGYIMKNTVGSLFSKKGKKDHGKN